MKRSKFFEIKLCFLLAITCSLPTGSHNEPLEEAQRSHYQQSDTNNQEPANNEKPFASMLNSAVINGKVSLPCDISPANSDDSVALILWYKDDSLAPIYTIDARKGNSLESAKTSVDDAYANRATFSTKSKPAQLQLEPVKQEDEGEYRCRVDFRRGRTVNTIISLRVVILPEELRIVAPQRPQNKLEGLIGPFNEGAELTLVCLANGGKPRPQLSWRRDFNVIDETYQHVDKEGTSNELKLSSLNKNHLLSIFTCQATNNNLTSPMQTSITLDLNLKPQEVSLRQLVQEPLVVGQTATFECLTQGSRPQATIHWLFQGIRHDTPMNVDQQQTSSRLSLTLQRSFNQQSLVCVAENPRIPQTSALKQTIKLDVHYPPQLSIRLEPPMSANKQPEQQADQQDLSTNNNYKELALAAHLQEGNDIYLTCQMEANPRPAKPILWRFNGKVLQQQQQQQANSMLVMNNQSLVLRKVSRHQSGSYSCDASNQHGANSSKPMDLIIRHAPVCATDDIPIERNLSNWMQRDIIQDEQIDESSSRLNYKIKNENGYGLIKCEAKNEIGLQQRACLVQVRPAPPPALRHGCSLAKAAVGSLQVACELSEHLKSDEVEMMRLSNKPVAPSSGGAMSNWLNLEAIRAQPQSSLSADRHDASHEPNLRLVFPPNWILAELYKLHGSTNSDSSGELGQQDLIAYVVVGSSQQLAHIKSIVEQNKIFSANPKNVYYVIAKQQAATNGTAQPESQLIHHTQSAHQASIQEDPSIKLADSFNFTVPNLEPQSRYKLLIYGQNLANKTRDWIVVRGETLQDEAISRSPSSAMSQYLEGANLLAGSRSGQDSSRLQEETDRQMLQTNSSLQKSIVMRSDQVESGETDQQSEQQQAATSASAHKPDQFYSNFTGKMHLYKDYALNYAKQKPLLALPMAILLVLILTLIAARSSSFFVHLVRPRRGSGSAASKDNNKADSSGQKATKLDQLAQRSALFSSSPDDGSYASSSRQDQASISKQRRDSVTSGAIYAIENDTGGAMQLQNYDRLHLEDQFLAQSLDRRQLHQSASMQPVYLTETSLDSPFLQLHNQQHQHIGSIDRKTGAFMSCKQPPVLIAELSHLNGLQLTPQSGQLAYEQQSTGRSRQRVAFDLSNQQPARQLQLQHPHPHPQQHQQQQQQSLYRSESPQSRVIVSPALGELAQEIRAAKCLYVAPQTKGSDSGGSNSGNTADSGHESPPTGDTNSASFSRNCLVQGELIASHNQAASSMATQCRHQNRRQHQQDQCCPALQRLSSSQGDANNNLLMLMELSPGSQESSTLLQSVDSFAELPQTDICQLLHNQISTSFTSTCDKQPIYVAHAQKQHPSNANMEMDNWI